MAVGLRSGAKAPSGSSPGNHAGFFASLPQDELTPLESGLRQVLLDWMLSLPGASFPLTEWIDRRIGGEMETRRDDKGQTEIFLRGQPPGGRAAHFPPPPGNFGRAPPPGVGYPAPPYPPHHLAPGPPPPVTPQPERKGAGRSSASEAQKFFSGLPTDSFSKLEEDLRDAIFDFLASWKSQALANLADLNKDQNVSKFRQRFMPKEVNLGEWIEKRIGGEIELQREPNSSAPPVIHLSKPAQAIVADKYKRMEAGNRPGASAGRGPSGSAQPKAEARSREPPRAPEVSKEDFFKTLPADELTPEELALHDGILDWLGRWPAQKPEKRGSLPLLGDITQDGPVMKLKNACMSTKVPLRDWIDRRVGGEVEIRKDSKGQLEVLIRGSDMGRTAEKPPATAPANSSKGGSRGKGGSVTAQVSPDDFFAGLPDDSLTDDEAELRLCVLDLVEQRAGETLFLGDLAKEPEIVRLQQSLLPQEVPLRQWINRRIGGEVKIDKDSKGQLVLMKTDATPASRPDAGDKKDDLFATLPDDCFLPEEEELRDTLLAFIGNWKGDQPPSLSAAGGDADIRRARAAVLPKGCQVSLKDWIERRIGGEIELAMDPRGSGQWLFGLRGALDLPPARSQGNKRRRM